MSRSWLRMCGPHTRLTESPLLSGFDAENALSGLLPLTGSRRFRGRVTISDASLQGFPVRTIMADVTRILSEIEQGDSAAAEKLLPLVYDELRKLAAQKMVNEKPGQTLQATALVHEAYVRLVDVDKAQHWVLAEPLLCRRRRGHAADRGRSCSTKAASEARWSTREIGH